MKALVYTGVEELIYREEKDPVETSGESILKVHASGICGSDMTRITEKMNEELLH